MVHSVSGLPRRVTSGPGEHGSEDGDVHVDRTPYGRPRPFPGVT